MNSQRVKRKFFHEKYKLVGNPPIGRYLLTAVCSTYVMKMVGGKRNKQNLKG
jgi:hypothetical protein